MVDEPRPTYDGPDDPRTASGSTKPLDRVAITWQVEKS